MVHLLRGIFRRWARSPAGTAVLVLILGLGIGVNIGLFSVMNAVLLRPLPFRDADQLARVAIVTRDQGREFFQEYFSLRDFQWLKEAGGGFLDFAVIQDEDKSTVYYLSGTDEPERLKGARISSGFVDLIGVRPVLGRGVLPAEQGSGSAEALISQGLWKRRFGADAGVIGQKLVLNEKPYTVVGVMPPSAGAEEAALGRGVEIWTPLSAADMRRGIRLIARADPATSLEQAQLRLQTLPREGASQILSQGEIRLTALHEVAFRTTRPYFIVLNSAGLLALLITCANAAGILLTRSMRLRREMALRAALGASRGRLVREFVAEGVLTSALSAILALVCAFLSVGAFASLFPATLPRLGEVSIDSRVLLFSLAITLLAGLCLGLLSALPSLASDLWDSLRQTGRQAASGMRSRRLDLVAVFQMALAAMLLISTGLVLRSFLLLAQVDPGFKAEKILTMDVYLPLSKYWAGDGSRSAQFYRQLTSDLEALPDVVAADVTSSLPVRPRDYLKPGFVQRVVGPGYFEALGILFLAGRNFAPTEGAGFPKAAVINESAARMFFPGQDPLRKIVDDDYEVVGVVADTRHQGLDSPAQPAVYVHYLQEPDDRMSLVIRTVGEPLKAVAAVRSRIRLLDEDQPISNISALETMIAESGPVARRRFMLFILSMFGALATLLAAVGTYWVLSYQVAESRHEMGVRLAIGAKPSQVRKLLLRRGIGLTIAGAVAGLAGAFLLSASLSSFLYQVSPQDPLAFVGASLFLLAAGMLGSILPARRAAKCNPLDALRDG